jgi:hypothetical protein
LIITRKLLVLVVLVISSTLCSNRSWSQEQLTNFRTNKNALSVLPQYVLINGIRLDYERRLGKGDLWLLLAPQYYNDNTGYQYYYYSYYSSNDPYYRYDEMQGVGANLYVKWIVSRSERLDRISGKPARLLYLAAGPTFQYYQVTSFDEVPVAYEENGTTYYRFEIQEGKHVLNRYGGNVNMGIQFAMDPFFVDLYWGFGYKIGFDGNGERASSGLMIEPFYTGETFDAGFKFGVYF